MENFFSKGKDSEIEVNRSGMELALGEYTRTGSNASQAARMVYGGTPISVRVKGHKKKLKLKPILDKIDKIWDGLLEVDPDGPDGWKKTSEEVEGEVDAYLKRLKRKNCGSL